MDSKATPAFAELLRRYRAVAGLTQEELAARSGLTPQAISLLERGERQRPQAYTFEKLAEVLELAEADRARFAAAARTPLSTEVPLHSGEHPVHAPRTNLPFALSSLIGRKREQGMVLALLERARLVTLTGAGGVGKTRLALAVGGAALSEYPQGVWLVELAALADPGLVAGAVAQALGLREEPGRPLLATLSDHLRDRHVLLVLDNCEHLIGACAELAAALLTASPRPRLLATSRERLEVAGEQCFRVPSLAVPDPSHLPPLAELDTYEAVQLFVERAQARQPEFALTAHNAWEVAEVCARLDGIPLALELAAARVGSVPVAGIAARLDGRLQLLTGGSRTALPRQRTLRATLDWSYALLSAPERALLARLAVFSGGWTLEAAEAVGAGEDVEAPEELDGLAGLVDKSLVQLDEQEGSARYGMHRRSALDLGPRSTEPGRL